MDNASDIYTRSVIAKFSKFVGANRCPSDISFIMLIGLAASIPLTVQVRDLGSLFLFVLIRSRLSPYLQGSLTGFVLPREDLNVSTTPGKGRPRSSHLMSKSLPLGLQNTVLEVSQWTDLQFKEFVSLLFIRG